jgi:DNA-directed RNA polymerase specialized sigma24 family protein
MAAAGVGAVLRQIRSLTAIQKNNEQTDGALLRDFLERSDQAAFEALVRRHGPMVLCVCRRVLGDAHDADDAFQATFLDVVLIPMELLPKDDPEDDDDDDDAA